MDGIELFKALGVTTSIFDYMAPEGFEWEFAEAIEAYGKHVGAEQYRADVRAKMQELFPGPAKDWRQRLKAVVVLTRMYTGFKSRISGKIKDDWLSAKTFANIAAACVDVLALAEEHGVLKPWQLKLRPIFAAMCAESE